MPALSESRYFDPRLFARMANLEFIARHVVEGMITGRHQSPFHGFSVEFSEYRKYAPGDDPKHIDWKVMAKSDRVYVKQFEAETNLRAYILLDVSGSMGYGHGAAGGGGWAGRDEDKGLTKLQYCSYATAAMAYLLIRQMDAVGLVTFDREIRSFLAPKSGPQQLRAILTTLEQQEAHEETNISSSFHLLAERLHRRGLILVFSDFLDDPEQIVRGLSHFRHKKHEVILFHVKDADEEDFPFLDFLEFEDMETQQRLPVQARLVGPRYRERFRQFTQDLQRRCAEQGIEYVPLRTDTPVEVALLRYLGKRARLG